MEKIRFTVSQAAEILSKDLELNVTESRIRSYENTGLIEIKRDEESDYRLFTGEDIEKLKIIIVLAEISISQDDIRLYLANPKDVRVLKLILEKIITMENILPIANKLIGKKTFERLPK